jgi:hypothetical protein
MEPPPRNPLLCHSSKQQNPLAKRVISKRIRWSTSRTGTSLLLPPPVVSSSPLPLNRCAYAGLFMSLNLDKRLLTPCKPQPDIDASAKIDLSLFSNKSWLSSTDHSEYMFSMGSGSSLVGDEARLRLNLIDDRTSGRPLALHVTAYFNTPLKLFPIRRKAADRPNIMIAAMTLIIILWKALKMRV